MYLQKPWTLKTYSRNDETGQKFLVPWNILVKRVDPFDVVLAQSKINVPIEKAKTDHELVDLSCNTSSDESTDLPAPKKRNNRRLPKKLNKVESERPDNVLAGAAQPTLPNEFITSRVTRRKAVAEKTKKGKSTLKSPIKKDTAQVTKKLKTSEIIKTRGLRDRNLNTVKPQKTNKLLSSDSEENCLQDFDQLKKLNRYRQNIFSSKENKELQGSSIDFEKKTYVKKSIKRKDINHIIEDIIDECCDDDEKQLNNDNNLTAKNQIIDVENNIIKSSTSKNVRRDSSDFTTRKPAETALVQHVNSTVHSLESSNECKSDGRANIDNEATKCKLSNVRFNAPAEFMYSKNVPIKKINNIPNSVSNVTGFPRSKLCKRAISTPVNAKILPCFKRQGVDHLNASRFSSISPIVCSGSYSTTASNCNLEKQSLTGISTANSSSILSLENSAKNLTCINATFAGKSFISEVLHRSSKCLHRVTELVSNRENDLEESSEVDLSLMFAGHKNLSSLTDNTSAKDVILQLCGQKTVLTFDDIFKKRLSSLSTAKIGEGAYADVYKIDCDGAVVAVKIVPLGGNSLGNERLPSFKDMLSEVLITKTLSDLRNNEHNSCSTFIKVIQMSFVKGPYLPSLVSAWKRYDKNFESANDSPENFPKEQNYLVFKFEDGGSDLEHVNISDPSEVLSIFRQISHSLAVAEKSCSFEHRDLHCGNVLVSKTTLSAVTYMLDDKPIYVETSGVVVKIIDYTLSRIEKRNVAMFTDLAVQEELFNGQGDSQYEVYRQMREINNNIWRNYHPRTNVLWMNHVLEKMMTMLKRSKSKNMAAYSELCRVSTLLKSSFSAYEFVKRNLFKT